MKATKIIFYISTGLMTALMAFSVGMYLTNPEIGEVFNKLGYPSYIPYPLAAAKVLGLIAIWSGVSQKLKEWAYAGFFFDFVLAFTAHIAIGDGEFAPAALAIVLVLASYFTYPDKPESD